MKTAIVSGASSGIGEALARELAARGYRRIALTARREEKLAELAAGLSGRGCEASTFACDIRDADAVRQGVERVVTAWGVPDLAIANAGVGFPTPATTLSLDGAREIMRTNFEGMLNLFAPIVPAMCERRSGHIAGVASLAGHRGLPGSSMYSASKAAMQAWLEASRIELRHHGVDVTTVNPGWVETPMIRKNRHPMPFMMSAGRAAKVICDGLETKARVIEFPIPMSIAVRILRWIPGFLYDRLAAPYGKAKTG
jgi:short-subunit dehydrogenase